MNSPTTRLLVAPAALVVVALTASAQITGYDLGTDVPPTSLDGYTFTPFPSDPTPINSQIYSVASPLGGDLGLATELLPPYSYHLTIGNGWSSWSQGYTGDVYSDTASHAMTLTLPPSTGAFYFYAEPNPQYPVPFSVTADETTPQGASIQTYVFGSSGANGFAFVAPAGSTISTIQVKSLYGFAVGEFGVASAVPEPSSTAVAVGVGLAVMAGARRFRSNTRSVNPDRRS